MNIDKQYDREDTIWGEIICVLINNNNYMSTPMKQMTVSPTCLRGRHSPVDPQKRQYMRYVYKNVQWKNHTILVTNKFIHEPVSYLGTSTIRNIMV